MQIVRVLLLSALTLDVSAGAAAAQQIQIQQSVDVVGGEALPMGLQGRPVRTGSGRIRGRVLSADAGTPVRRAQVRLLGTDMPSRTATTDADGRYDFADLPDGRFSISATKAGYVSVQYGQLRPFEAGKSIELLPKQVLDKADIFMPRGSAIVGRIVDEFGEPLAEAMVTALRQQWLGGRRRLVNSGRTAQTNDLGQFRMYGLPPGDYFVSATLRNGDGPMFDMLATTPSAPLRTAAAPSGYAPTYYPGTVAAAEAQKLTVAVGQETQGIDFALLPVRLARISGIVINSDGRPVEGTMVGAVPARGLEGTAPIGGNARTNREGAFTLTSVPPGDYILQVRGVTIFTSGGDNVNMMVTTRLGGPGGEAEFAAQPVSVSGEDLSNIVITTTRGGTATGKVTFEGDRPAAANNLRIASLAPDADGLTSAPLGELGTAVKADGTFELKGLSGSPRLFRVNGLPAGWVVKAVEANGIDVTDTGVELKGSEPVGGIEIILSPKSTEISGGVTGADGTPAKDYTVVIFAEDPGKWAVPLTRWVTGTRPDQDGRFRVRNMPPGAYHAIAVDYLPRGDWNDPEVLDRLKAKAQRLLLGEGETKILDLKIAGGA